MDKSEVTKDSVKIFSKIFRGLLLLGVLVAAGFLVNQGSLGGMLDEHWVDSDIRGKGISGELLFLAVGCAFTAVGLPRQIVAFLGGYAFGFLYGALLGVIAAVLGCTVAFYFARFLARPLVEFRLPERIRKTDAFLRQNPFSMAVMLRLLPIGSNLVTNVVSGVSSVKGIPFIVGSAVGYLPQNLVFSLVGSGVNVESTIRITLGILLFVISMLLGLHLFRRLRVQERNGL